MGIFLRGFADCANVLLPRMHMLSHSINLGVFAPDVTPEITHINTHLKPVTLARHLSGHRIPWMHNQYTFGRFGMISAPRNLAC